MPEEQENHRNGHSETHAGQIQQDRGQQKQDIEPDGMVKGWNSRTRRTSKAADSRVAAITAIVSRTSKSSRAGRAPSAARRAKTARPDLTATPSPLAGPRVLSRGSALCERPLSASRRYRCDAPRPGCARRAASRHLLQALVWPGFSPRVDGRSASYRGSPSARMAHGGACAA